MDAASVCRCIILWCCIYITDTWTEECESGGSIADFKLESCFSVLAGWIILGERLSFRESLGCILMFLAIILAQLPDKK